MTFDSGYFSKLYENIKKCFIEKFFLNEKSYFSCPANVMPWQGADAVSFASLPPSKYSSVHRAGYRYLLTGIFSVHRALIWMRSHFEQNIYEQHFSYFHLLKCTDLPQRQLYLYSRADTICSHTSIEDFQRRQLEVNPQVELAKVCWEDSSHVEHLRKYASEYTEACTRFVDGADVASISKSSGTSDPTGKSRFFFYGKNVHV